MIVFDLDSSLLPIYRDGMTTVKGASLREIETAILFNHSLLQLLHGIITSPGSECHVGQ